MEIVLVEPQIPQNTGSIARTCAALKRHLHLVGPTPFEISDKAVRRAGLDYWPYVKLTQHDSWEEYLAAKQAASEKSTAEQPSKVVKGTTWYFTTKSKTPYWNATFHEGDTLVFGSETKGLGEEFLATVPQENMLLIPMREKEVRSLNLSNSVSIAIYEAERQIAQRIANKKA